MKVGGLAARAKLQWRGFRQLILPIRKVCVQLAMTSKEIFFAFKTFLLVFFTSLTAQLLTFYYFDSFERDMQCERPSGRNIVAKRSECRLLGDVHAQFSRGTFTIL